MMEAMILFAAKHHEDPVITIIGLAVFVFLAIIIIAAESSARYHVNVRGGLPYCPQCNRQVSYRRDRCRACGYQFKSYGGNGSAGGGSHKKETYTKPETPKQAKERERLGLAMAEERARLRNERWAAERAERKAQRNVVRDAAYRARGVEPGPWAWFKVLPDLVQALLIGLAFALPAVILLVILLSGLG